MDATLCALLVIHSHIGFEYVITNPQFSWFPNRSYRACIIDYFPKYRVPGVHKLAMWALRAGTVILGVALYSFETNDVGVTEAVSRIWHA